jgi:hypothetical protein
MKLFSIFLLSFAGALHAAPIDDLTLAAANDNVYAMTKLLAAGLDPNGRDAQGRSALEVSLRESSAKAVNALLRLPAVEVNSANAAGESPLMLAALLGQLDLAKKLVARGARINKAGWTPLHYACSGPDEGVIAWLLSQGADINARSPNGSTPLMMAARYGSLDSPGLLLAAGADAMLRNEQGLQAVDFARAAGRDQWVKKLGALTAK